MKITSIETDLNANLIALYNGQGDPDEPAGVHFEGVPTVLLNPRGADCRARKINLDIRRESSSPSSAQSAAEVALLLMSPTSACNDRNESTIGDTRSPGRITDLGIVLPGPSFSIGESAGNVFLLQFELKKG